MGDNSCISGVCVSLCYLVFLLVLTHSVFFPCVLVIFDSVLVNVSDWPLFEEIIWGLGWECSSSREDLSLLLPDPWKWWQSGPPPCEFLNPNSRLHIHEGEHLLLVHLYPEGETLQDPDFERWRVFIQAPDFGAGRRGGTATTTTHLCHCYFCIRVFFKGRGSIEPWASLSEFSLHQRLRPNNSSFPSLPLWWS